MLPFLLAFAAIICRALSAFTEIFSFWAALPVFFPPTKVLKSFTKSSIFFAKAGGTDELVSFLSPAVLLKGFASPTLPFAKDATVPLSSWEFMPPPTSLPKLSVAIV